MFLLSAALAQPAPPIVNGSKDNGKYKAVGALFSYWNNQGGQFCSGTLVHRKYVITAAHCVVAAQEYEAEGWDIYWVSGDDVYNGSWEKYGLVYQMWANPGYNPNSASIQDDIGVLELKTSMGGWPTQAISHTSPKTSWVGEPVTYVGFGITRSNSNDGGVRRWVEVPMAGADSDFIYTYYGGSGTVKNICSGDSGGAALMDFDGEMVLVGANSFGFNWNGGSADCDVAGAAGASTRTDAFWNWIVQYIPEEELNQGGDADADSDADSDTDADSDADSDTDTDLPDSGLVDTNSPSRPASSTLDTGLFSGCASAPLSGGLLLALTALWRRS